MSFSLIAKKGSKQIEHEINAEYTTVGRSKDADISLPAEWSLASSIHLEIKKISSIYYIKDGFNGNKSTNGTQLNNTFISSEKWTILKTEDEVKIGFLPNEAINISISDSNNYLNSRSSIKDNWTPKNGKISIGRSSSCDIIIEGPTISRKHCVISKNKNGYIIEDTSSNGLFLNNIKLAQRANLIQNDLIKIGSHIFIWADNTLAKHTIGRNYRIDVRDLTLKGRVSGTNISIEPGSLVALVGGSGAGKSSLLTTIVGHNMNYSGSISINGSELRNCLESVKQEIGFVPQDDIIHTDLSIHEVLSYSARLKLPDKEQQHDAVERVLKELDIGHRRSALVRNLSGGQRKRVSIGVELLADPRILFLDEPTSGLDPGLDKRMMELLRELADAGRTVALVTHATNNVTLCDQVVFLGRGGYLCYAGPPEECMTHFGITGDFSDIYQYLEKDVSEISKIADSYRPIILSKLPKIINTYQKEEKEAIYNSISGKNISKYCNQLLTLLSRDILLASRDKTSLALNAVTAPLAILMIFFATNNKEIFIRNSIESITVYQEALRILFVILCSTIWVGLSSSLQVLVKERLIFRRERSFNLLPTAYLSSKIVMMILQAIFQSSLILFTIGFCYNSPENSFLPWPIGIAFVSFLTLITVGSQALLVSGLVASSQQAASAAPLLLIPQLIFGGVLFILKDSNNFIYPFITSRWSMISIGIYTNIESLIPIGQVLPGSTAYESTWGNLSHSLIMLIGQTFIFLLLSLLSLYFVKHNK